MEFTSMVLRMHAMAEQSPHETSELIWTDPQTGKRFRVDARTGNSCEYMTSAGIDEATPRAASKSRRTIAKRQQLEGGHVHRAADTPEWLLDALQVGREAIYFGLG